MAFVTVNNYDVEHASQMLVYENLMVGIQHINGKGVIDTYTKTDDVRSVTFIDIKRILPSPVRFRRVGSSNNGGWHNVRNEGGFNNAPQSVHYTIPVDLFYDEGIALMETQEYSSPTNLKAIVMSGLIKAMQTSINAITFAKQYIGYFRDSFKAENGTATEKEIANSVFAYDPAVAANADGSVTDAFIAANTSLSKGVPELGAFAIPADRRQAFITYDFDRYMQRQYAQNASDAAARINSTGYIDPFTGHKGVRVDTLNTGMAGTYNGVDMFLFNENVKLWTYIALGIYPADSGAEVQSEDQIAAETALDKIGAMIVYADTTVRGIVGPTVEVNKHPFQQGVYIAPALKVGVEVLSGKGIKMVVNGGWTSDDIAAIKKVIKFTEIDGVEHTGAKEFAGIYNDGTSK